MTDARAGIGRGAAVAFAGTALSRITGFVRVAAAAFALGVTESRLHDTYNLANITPNIIFELVIGGVISGVVLRIYVEVRDRESKEEAWIFITRLTKASLLVMAVVAGIAVFAAPLIMRLYALRAGASADIQQEVGTVLLRLFIPQIFFYALSQISTAVLNAERRFGVVMFAPVMNNVAWTATFLTFAAVIPIQQRGLETVPVSGLLILGLGTTFSVSLLGLTPFLYMRQLGAGRVKGTGIRDPRFRRLLALMIPLFAYVATNQLGRGVASVLANQVRGGVTAYDQAFIFFQLPHGLFSVSIAVVILTGMTESAVAEDMTGFARRLSDGLRAIAFFALPAAAGYIALSRPLVRLLLEHGVMSPASTDMIATVLRFWAAGIFFFSAFYLMLRAFYALGNTRTPMYINLAAFGINVVLDVVLFAVFDDPGMKIAGLAIGHALSYVFASVTALIILSRVAGRLVAEKLGSRLVKMVGAAAATGAVAWAVARQVEQSFGTSSVGLQLAQVAGAAGAGLVVYVLLAKLLHLEEMQWIAKIATRR
ncbi:MAG TPA: murein biosynthesis integral membrane protein MurJ [Actinomycetota bacterium]|nr:murein biosynthesis integral membrane protein MurJ [Actinomycetota bacterium]